MKRVLLWLFILCFSLSLLSIFTPLNFNYPWLANGFYIVSILLSFFAAKTISNKVLKAIVNLTPLCIFLAIMFGSLIFHPMGNKFTSGWQTTFIEYRLIKQPKICIAHQMMDIGALGYRRRFVKIVPVLPLMSWITPAGSTYSGKDWKKVNEDLNPFNLK